MKAGRELTERDTGSLKTAFYSAFVSCGHSANRSRCRRRVDLLARSGQPGLFNTRDRAERTRKRKLVSHEIGKMGQPGYMGSNSRSRADKLRELGWKGDERETISVWDSVEQEVELLIGSGQLESKQMETR